MSLITCCPACGTMFRVVPDQLKISDGWVRCGHCSEVFDAAAHMMQEEAVMAPAQASRPTGAEHAGPAEITDFSARWADEGAIPAPLVRPSPEPQPPAAPEPAFEDSQHSGLEESPLDQPFVFRRSDLAVPAEESESALGLVSTSAGPRDAVGTNEAWVVDAGPSAVARARDEDNAPEAQPGVDELSFVRDARRKAFWQRGPVRAVLVLAALALAVLLAAQVAVHERARIVAAQPDLRPLFEALCAPLQCRVEAPRLIESVSIEGSSFNKTRGDVYRLNATIKNQAGVEVELPALELTLTDAQDQPVLRRVLQPRELGATAPTLAAGAEWAISVPVGLAADGQAGRIAGYRLLAFYP